MRHGRRELVELTKKGLGVEPDVLAPVGGDDPGAVEGGSQIALVRGRDGLAVVDELDQLAQGADHGCPDLATACHKYRL